MPTPVTDAFSNRPEHIQESARVVGKSIPRRAVYAEIYRGSKRVKTVSEIARNTSLGRKTVLNRGRELERGGVVTSTTRDGEQAYAQIAEQQHIKEKVLALAGNIKAIESIPTKRSLTIKGPIVSVVKNRVVTEAKKKAHTDTRWRIALMLASPVGQDALNVSMEAREIESERRKAISGDAFSLKSYLAADTDSWLTALNDYEPNIIHFSGHGGSSSLLLDNSNIESFGGTAVNFAILSRILRTAKTRPKLLVLNACDTLKGADTLTQAVDIVIAMTDSIADSSAFHYSRRLYAALFAGLNVVNAHDQASAALAIDSLSDSVLPTIINAPGIIPSEVSFQ